MGAILLAVVGTYAYLGGWLTPRRLTAAKFTNALERIDGVHPGFRRNHAKGIGVTGYFESDGNGASLSKAVLFKPGRVPVRGRFSLGGGDPYAADASTAVRGLGLLFSLPDGEEWRTAMINLPVFPVNSPRGFYERLVAAAPDPRTGKPDPEKMKAFLARHPETKRAIGIFKTHPASSGFANTTFNGLNAFRFIDAQGVSVPVRWSMVPLEPIEPAAAPTGTPGDKNWLFDTLVSRLSRGPLQWHLIVTVGQPKDPTDDATIPWPQERERVDVGTLTIDRFEADDTSPSRDINFDPLVLPSGIEPSNDPLLSARSAVYSKSYTNRAGEPNLPSAVHPAEAGK